MLVQKPNTYPDRINGSLVNCSVVNIRIKLPPADIDEVIGLQDAFLFLYVNIICGIFAQLHINIAKTCVACSICTGIGEIKANVMQATYATNPSTYGLIKPL